MYWGDTLLTIPADDTRATEKKGNQDVGGNKGMSSRIAGSESSTTSIGSRQIET